VQYEIEIEIAGSVRQVAVERRGGAFIVIVDGRAWAVDAARVDEATLSLLISRPGGSGGSRGSGGSGESGGSGVPGASGGAGESAPIARSFEVSVVPSGTAGRLAVRVGGVSMDVVVQPGSVSRTSSGLRGSKRTDRGASTADGPQRLVAPMPGKIVRILAGPGDQVRARQAVVVIEAMKMENELRADRDAVVAEVLVREGQSVEAGVQLALLRPLQAGEAARPSTSPGRAVDAGHQ
jgi:biotin carboxyl carrier protein